MTILLVIFQKNQEFNFRKFQKFSREKKIVVNLRNFGSFKNFFRNFSVLAHRNWAIRSAGSEVMEIHFQLQSIILNKKHWNQSLKNQTISNPLVFSHYSKFWLIMLCKVSKLSNAEKFQKCRKIPLVLRNAKMRI
jgi:hypothetical protein